MRATTPFVISSNNRAEIEPPGKIQLHFSLKPENELQKSSPMNLNEEQRQRVTAWILQGAKLSEVQDRLNKEYGLRLTYMETRFLVDDLKLTPKDPEPPKKTKPRRTPRNPAAFL
jgi:transposase